MTSLHKDLPLPGAVQGGCEGIKDSCGFSWMDKAGVCVGRAVQEEVVAGAEVRVGWAGSSLEMKASCAGRRGLGLVRRYE